MSTQRVEVCELCRGSLSAATAPEGLEDAPVAECPGCGLVITTPRPPPEEIGAYYPDSYYAHVGSRRSLGRRLADRIKAYRGGYPSEAPLPARVGWVLAARALGGFYLTGLPYRGPGRRLLDVGCGNGDALAWAKELGWEAYGVEPDPAAVEHAWARGLLEVRVGTVEEQHFPDDFFDAITMYQVLEHVYSPSEVLAECLRILKPGGELFVAVPNFDSTPRRVLGQHWHALQLPIHLYHFSPATLGQLVQRAGFDTVEVRYYSRLVSLVTTLKCLRSKSRQPAGGSRSGGLRTAARDLGRLWSMRHERLSDIMLFVLRKPG